MKISKEELQKIIKEEVNEIFGFGKKKKVSKEYPASELATIIRALDDASKMSGAELTPSQREAIVDELTGVLEDKGFVVRENERLFTGEEDVVVTHQNAPKLKVFLDTVVQKNSKVFKQLLGVFNRSALDISPLVKTLAQPANRVTGDEDQTATIKAEPVVAPDDEEIVDPGTDSELTRPAAYTLPYREPREDLAVTIKTEPVDAADDEEDSKWDAALDKVQAGLDIAGAIGLYPPAMILSKPATLASLALNTSRGMYGWALFDLISLTPLVGEAMKAGKLGVKGTKLAKAAKIKKFGAMRKLVKAGHAGNARKAAKSVKTARAGKMLDRGTKGLVELIPEELLQKLINEKTDEGEPMVPWMIETLAQAPGFGDVAPKLLAAWDDVVALAGKEEKESPDQIGPLKEHKQFNRMKVLAGIK